MISVNSSSGNYPFQSVYQQNRIFNPREMASQQQMNEIKNLGISPIKKQSFTVHIGLPSTQQSASFP